MAEKNKTLYSATSGISGEHFDITDPGEYDIKGVTVTGIPLKQDEKYIAIYLIESEDIRILNLTHIRDFNLKEEELEELGDIDILLLPVGDNSVLSAANASKTVNSVEPKIVIPSHYKMPGLIIDVDAVDKFIKEMGGKNEKMEKLSLKKKDLVEEGTKVIVLEPLR